MCALLMAQNPQHSDGAARPFHGRGHGRGRMPEGDADELKPKDASLAMGIGLDRHNAAVAASAKMLQVEASAKKSKKSCKHLRLSIMQVSCILIFLHEQKLISKLNDEFDAMFETVVTAEEQEPEDSAPNVTGVSLTDEESDDRAQTPPPRDERRWSPSPQRDLVSLKSRENAVVTAGPRMREKVFSPGGQRSLPRRSGRTWAKACNAITASITPITGTFPGQGPCGTTW